MIEDLKKGILLKIDDTLETLQLRLMLNKDTIVSEQNESTALREAIELYRSIAQQNQEAHLAIKECEESIAKLLLLKKYTADLSLDAIVSLYNNSKVLSMPEFQRNLTDKLSVRQSSQYSSQ